MLSSNVLKYPYECEIEPAISDHHMVVLTWTLNEGLAQWPEEATFRDMSTANDVAIIDKLDLSYDDFECLSPEQLKFK